MNITGGGERINISLGLLFEVAVHLVVIYLTVL